MDSISRIGFCRGDKPCRLVFATPALAILLPANCPTCEPYVFRGAMDGTWTQRLPEPPEPRLPNPGLADDRAMSAARVEVRAVERSQVFVDGQPVGPAFE